MSEALTATLAVVLVTYDSADGLPAVLDALREQRRPGDEIVVVDNGSRDGSPGIARDHPAVDRVLEPGANVGFAAGCNAGARTTSASVLLFLNPDAVPQPGCLEALRSAPGEWAAWQAVVTQGGGRRVNSAGNELQFLGFSWAGGCEAQVDELPDAPYETTCLSGACLAVRRSEWIEFSEPFFMYFEDVDLSLRLRLAGQRVGVLPRARVEHDYTFHKGTDKWRRLERNRWLCILRCWPARLLLPTLPLLLALEPLLLAIALKQGWAPAKLRAIVGVVRALPRVLAERRAIQADRSLSTAGFAALMTSRLDSPHFGPIGRLGAVRMLLDVSWRGVLVVAGVR